MVKHVWTVLCTLSITDGERNNVSLIEVLERLTIHSRDISLPGIIPRGCELVSLWSRSHPEEPSRAQMRAQLVSPSETIVHQIERDLDLSAHERLRTMIRMEGFPVSEFGYYHFRVQLRNENEDEWYDVASVPLEIRHEPRTDEDEDDNIS